MKKKYLLSVSMGVLTLCLSAFVSVLAGKSGRAAVVTPDGGTGNPRLVQAQEATVPEPAEEEEEEEEAEEAEEAEEEEE